MAQTWIFQANPDIFDIDKFLVHRPGETSWLVTRLGNEMSLGDEVFIWRAIGKGASSESGIIAKAEITQLPQVRADDPRAIPFWRSASEGASARLRVGIRVLRVATKRELLQRSWLVEDPHVSDLQILKLANGTNYKVSEPHATRLSVLWEKVGKNWNYAESVAGLWAYAQTYDKQVSRLPGSPVADVAVKIGRSVSGVYNKVMNFRSIDPRDSREGLDGASTTDREVWAEFFNSEDSYLEGSKLDAEFFRLWPRDERYPVDVAEAEKSSIEREAIKLSRLSLAELEAAYARSNKKPGKKPRVRKSSVRVIERDPIVIAIAKKRADYRCEVPKCPHPLFEGEDGLRFCEVHHIHPLGEGGDDIPSNVACICPSHHREAHHGTSATSLRKILEGLRD